MTRWTGQPLHRHTLVLKNDFSLPSKASVYRAWLIPIMATLIRHPRILLVTLDAFGTLYRPRQSIPVQYLAVAKACGLHINADTKDFGQCFKSAFKENYSRSPNYGKGTGMRPQEWWANVVTDTFRPLVKGEGKIPESLPDSLFHHFSGPKGYEPFPDTMPFFRQMRQWRQNLGPESGIAKIVVGVLTNSDPRVAGVLKSLGVMVGDGRHHDVRNDLDFVLTSYEIGHEKPSSDAFAAVEQIARVTLGLSKLPDESSCELIAGGIKVHIGDDLHQDYWGAMRSGRGWDAILLDRETGVDESPNNDVKHIKKLTDAREIILSKK